MAVCWFGVGGYLELPDHLTALRNLLPFDFTVKEFQTFVVRAGRKRNVTDVTVGDGPLDGGVEGVEELFDVEDGVRCVQGYRAEQDLLEILDLELFRVKILVLILIDAF